MSSRLLRLETFAFLSLVLVGSLLPLIMFESVRDASQPQSVIFQDYSALFKSLTTSTSGDAAPFDDDNEDELDDYDQDLPDGESSFEYTLRRTRKEVESTELFNLATDWRSSYQSNRCQALLRQGAEDATVAGSGARPGCLPLESSSVNASSSSSSYLSTAQATVHVSMSHRVIYIPSVSMFRMKAFFGFERAIKKRFRTKQIPERLLPLFLKHLSLNLTDFFVFTFVQHPLRNFVNNYNALRVNASLVEEGNTAKYALQQLERSQRALHPKHRDEETLMLFTQVFKTMRCVPAMATKRYKHQIAAKKLLVQFDFVGRLENLANDWRYVEAVLGVPHVPLHWDGGLFSLKHKKHARNPKYDVMSVDIFNLTTTTPPQQPPPPPVEEEEAVEDKPVEEEADAVAVVEEEEQEPVQEEDGARRRRRLQAADDPFAASTSLFARQQLKDAVCAYYKADFECLGYDDSMCE